MQLFITNLVARINKWVNSNHNVDDNGEIGGSKSNTMNVMKMLAVNVILPAWIALLVGFVLFLFGKLSKFIQWILSPILFPLFHHFFLSSFIVLSFIVIFCCVQHYFLAKLVIYSADTPYTHSYFLIETVDVFLSYHCLASIQQLIQQVLPILIPTF